MGVKKGGKDATVTGLCKVAGFSRQAFYQERRARPRLAVAQDAVVELVKAQRRIHPRCGTRKLHQYLHGELAEAGIKLGRDRLFALLRQRRLLVKRPRAGARTTDSRHGFHTWPNLIRNVAPSMPHQVWVSDLTYIRTDTGFLYLSLVTDAYSRKIVGFCAQDTLESEGCIKALAMAFAQLPQGAKPIHHSDRGTQYCCGAYVNALERRGCPISMTEQNHCYENAMAERVNGILKQEYGLGQTFADRKQGARAARQAVGIYNDLRLHTSLNYRTPSSVHAQSARERAA